MDNPGTSRDQEAAFRPKVIGIIHTGYRRHSGTPIQPQLADGAFGTVELNPEYTDYLKDLAGFDRIWLIYWFDRAASPKPHVVPYLDRHEHGLFATRAPSRPNPIGMSPVKLVRVEGNILTVKDVDILDETPLLDIKPYSQHFDCFPDSRSGWLEDVVRERWKADGRFER